MILGKRQQHTGHQSITRLKKKKKQVIHVHTYGQFKVVS